MSAVKARFGNSELSDEQAQALRKAVQVERITIGTQLCVVALVAAVAGQSQAMRVAFIEDALSLLPPLAFLIAVRRTRRRPDARHPYGHHRAVGAALVVSVGIIKDGVTNLRHVIEDLLDASATKIRSREPEPVIATLESCATDTPWVARAAIRVRDQGHVFHSEIFVVPRADSNPTVSQLDELRGRCIDADWRTQDTVVIPVEELPDGLTPVS